MFHATLSHRKVSMGGATNVTIPTVPASIATGCQSLRHLAAAQAWAEKVKADLRHMVRDG
jgi:hypothetical protein